MDNINRTEVLIEALPYIQKYNKKVVVIKYGGNAMINDNIKMAVLTDIVLLSLVGMRVVVVHGGGPEINDMLKKIGKESKFTGGLRYTDEETMEIVQMVLCGKLNKELVSAINRIGGRAIGMSGIDGAMMLADRLIDGGLDFGLVGNIVSVDPTPVIDALDGGYIPVISTVAQGRDAETAYNVNADTAAAKIATALGAEKLILLTDVQGLMLNPDDPESLLPVVHLSQIPGLKKDGIIKGGMIPKIDCCVEAMRKGVHRASILDGRVSHSVLIEMLSDEGMGTMLLI